jgi:hypothetical protein
VCGYTSPCTEYIIIDPGVLFCERYLRATLCCTNCNSIQYLAFLHLKHMLVKQSASYSIAGMKVFCVVQGDLANGINNDQEVQLPRQVVIPVDCVVPDMPVSMDEDSGHLNTMPQKYAAAAVSVDAAQNGTNYSTSMNQSSQVGTLAAYTAGGAGRTNSTPANSTHPSHAHVAAEPVVDLSVPTPYAQPDFMGAGFAPRQGQDIFDTWYVCFSLLSLLLSGRIDPVCCALNMLSDVEVRQHVRMYVHGINLPECMLQLSPTCCCECFLWVCFNSRLHAAVNASAGCKVGIPGNSVCVRPRSYSCHAQDVCATTGCVATNASSTCMHAASKMSGLRKRKRFVSAKNCDTYVSLLLPALSRQVSNTAWIRKVALHHCQLAQHVEVLTGWEKLGHCRLRHVSLGCSWRAVSCRQEGGMSAYQSGEEYDASGPLDTRERSFTGNPPVSSTGNTSPTQVCIPPSHIFHRQWRVAGYRVASF